MESVTGDNHFDQRLDPPSESPPWRERELAHDLPNYVRRQARLPLQR